MRSLLCAVVLFSSAGAAIAGTTVLYPMDVITVETERAAVFNRRQPRRGQPAPPVPPADGNRTVPVDPNATPKFEAAPEGGSPPLSLAELTPEQKQKLIQAIIAVVSALLGAFAGSGKAGPFITALLQAFKGIAAPAPSASAKVRARKSKA